MESIIYVGIDVHKDTYSLCSFDMQKDIFFSQHTMKASTANVASYLKKISESNGNAITVCGYEEGPTGYRLCLDLQQQGFNCVIMAPTSIAKTAKDKILKTDRADVQMLARTLAYHSYKQVVLPTENILAIKEVVMLRASVLKSCKKAKQNLLSFLLYHGISYPGGGRESCWTIKFFTWLKTVTFASDYLTYCFEEYVSEVSRLIQRLDRLNAKLKELESDKEISEGVKKLKCISGIDTVTAVSLIAETGDFNRFRSAKEFASYTGLIPGRHDSGLSVGNSVGITKQGNQNLRHLLVESAKSIKRATAFSHGQKSRRLLARLEGMDSEIINYADRAALRIKSRMRKLEIRGVNYNKAAVACARELACFAWG